jgi:hypothetical protein
MQGRIRLDDVVDLAPAAARRRDERSAEGAHDTSRNRAGHAERVPYGNDQLAHPQGTGVTELSRFEITGAHTHDRELRQPVGTHDLEVELTPVGERRGALPPIVDDVCGRHQITV